MNASIQADPDRDCALCPRLHDFIATWRVREPYWHNAPVATLLPPEGPESVRMLLVGLAPGLRGANRTGRAFTGDFAGSFLYGTLKKFDFAQGEFDERPDDGLQLVSTAVTNAVRCVPPQNKPTAAEINMCRSFLTATLERLENLRVIVTLGKIAHDSTVRMLGGRVAAHPFAHGAVTQIDGLTIVSSYHCSRYNTNTGRLTPEMFDRIFETVRKILRG